MASVVTGVQSELVYMALGSMNKIIYCMCANRDLVAVTTYIML